MIQIQFFSSSESISRHHIVKIKQTEL